MGRNEKPEETGMKREEETGATPEETPNNHAVKEKTALRTKTSANQMKK